MSGYQRGEALECPHGHKDEWNFRVEVVKFMRGITCCKDSKSTSLHLDPEQPLSTSCRQCLRVLEQGKREELELLWPQ